MTSLTYTFLVSDLFGNIWAAVLGTVCLFGLVGVLGKMGSFLLVVLLVVYLMNMAILIGGIAVWLLFMIFGILYFVQQLTKFYN